MIHPTKPRLGILASLGLAIQAAWRAWCKARPIPVKFVTGLADPVQARLDSGQGNPESSLPTDESSLVLYKDQYGGYATESMIRLGFSRLKGPFVYAHECNDETADYLVMQLEIVKMEADLMPAEEELLAMLKRRLADRYAE